jgi:predicted RNase H-like nuclease (RuvC/YqgF family)
MDLQEFLKDEKNKEQFQQVVKELGYESPEDVKGLRDKRDELLGKVSKYKSTISEYEKKLEEKEKMLDKFSGLDYTEIDKSKGSDELSVLKRKVAKYEEDFSLTKKERDALEAELNNTLIKNTLLSTLDEVGIDPVHKNLIISAHMPRAKVEKGDNGREVVIDDGGGLGLPAKEYFKKFTESEAGKIYLKQAENKGSGASKFSGASSGKTISESEFKNMPAKDRPEFIKNGGKII